MYYTAWVCKWPETIMSEYCAISYESCLIARNSNRNALATAEPRSGEAFYKSLHTLSPSSRNSSSRAGAPYSLTLLNTKWTTREMFTVLFCAERQTKFQSITSRNSCSSCGLRRRGTASTSPCCTNYNIRGMPRRSGGVALISLHRFCSWASLTA